MAINIDTALGIYPHTLRLRAARAEILAANLANSDTPNFKARDLDFQAALARSLAGTLGDSLTLAATRAGHMDGENAQLGGVVRYRNPMQPSIDGNTVETEVEQAEFARNAMHYQATLTFLGGRIKTLMTALRGD